MLDHSTISAVERPSGRIPVEHAYLIDADLIGLGAFIQAHLFCSQIVALDGYKSEHGPERKACFSHFLWFDRATFNYDDFAERIRSRVSDFSLRAKSGVAVDGELAKLVPLLVEGMAFTWRMASSAFWLRVAMLGAPGDAGIHRYSTTWEALLAAL